MEIISPIISIVALAVSLFTLWFTVLRRDKVKSVRPNLFAFTYDNLDNRYFPAKVFLRIALFSTGKRGVLVENLFLLIREGERCEEFSYWGYGDDGLVRGSGLFIPESGVVANHHFNPLLKERSFYFSPGRYSLELLAKLVGKENPVSLWKIELELPYELTCPAGRAFFHWSPVLNKYVVEQDDKRSA